jgi:hypothetical protein
MAQPDAKTMKRLVKDGKAMPSSDGTGRFPIRNADDLANAIRVVGRVQPPTDEARAKVRRFIIKRAKELKLSSRIPDNWAADGTLKTN